MHIILWNQYRIPCRLGCISGLTMCFWKPCPEGGRPDSVQLHKHTLILCLLHTAARAGHGDAEMPRCLKHGPCPPSSLVTLGSEVIALAEMPLCAKDTVRRRNVVIRYVARNQGSLIKCDVAKSPPPITWPQSTVHSLGPLTLDMGVGRGGAWAWLGSGMWPFYEWNE